MNYFSGKPRNDNFTLEKLLDNDLFTSFKSREGENSMKYPFLRINLNENYLIFGFLVIGDITGM